MCRKNLNGFKRIVVIIPSLKRVKDVAGEARAEKYEKKGNYGRHLNEYLKKRGGMYAMSQVHQKSVIVIAATKEKSSSC